MDFMWFESILVQLSLKSDDSKKGESVNETVPSLRLYTDVLLSSHRWATPSSPRCTAQL